MSEYQINKFGGSSVANADCFRKVAALVDQGLQITIVSAIAGTTNLLQALLDTAAAQDDYVSILDQIMEKQIAVVNDLQLPTANELLAIFAQDKKAISDILTAVKLTRSYSTQISDLILSFGETWSAQILAALLGEKHNACYLNAEQIIFVRHQFNVVQVDWEKSSAAMQAFLNQQAATHIVITGFIASDERGVRTTLGRNGSDFSAAIIAKLLNAKDVTIWTDVDGVYSADPRRVPKAFVIEQSSYQEILELSYFGAKVLHPGTIAPAIENHIAIHIKNTFNPSAPGTTISVDSLTTDYLVRGISSIDDVALLNIEGAGMVGVSGIAARLFQALSDAEISVIMISQASSEHSICIAVPSRVSNKAVNIIEKTFALEIKAGFMARVRVDSECAVIAAVGEGMVGTPGITARLGQALAQANISIKALAQGSSERNISAVIDRKDINKALRVVHSGFYLSGRALNIGLIGPGLIGEELLRQIFHARKKLQDDFAVKLSLRGIMNSKKMLVSEQEWGLDEWLTHFKKAENKADFVQFANQLLTDDCPHTVIIDCSASELVAQQYAYFMQQGIHIITPNKRANSGDFAYYQELIDMTRLGQQHYLYETTVCAGLPVIKTLQDMIQSGDEIHRLEGIVSGTLAYIFNELSTGKAFSSIVNDAKEKGYTEPDPRDDLAGMDVARKMVVLARDLGFAVELNDVKVHNLVPPALAQCSITEFLQRLPDYDADLQQQLAALVKPGEKAAYVGVINQTGEIEVKIGSYSNEHPFSHLRGTDNILAFYTARYANQPLVVQGPGAGAAVTAAGVFADLLRLVSFLD
jgi:aspartokinase/homoserine dehydrogenase 1